MSTPWGFMGPVRCDSKEQKVVRTIIMNKISKVGFEKK